MRDVLERAGDLLDARFHGALVYVRRVAFARHLSPRALSDPYAARALADELSDDLAALAVVASPTDVPAADVLVFRGQAERRAAHLVRRRRSASVAWWEEDLAGQDESAVLGEGVGVHGVLAALARAERLEEYLARASPAVLECVERALETTTAWPEVAGIDPDDDVATALATAAAAMSPSMPWRARRLTLALGAGIGQAAGRFPPRWLELADQALAAAHAGPPAPYGQPSADARPLGAAHLVVAHTGYAGLFFLLNLVLELEAAEILYTACLDERVLLAHALATLVPDDADPAPALAAGALPGAPVAAVTPEQAAEVSGALLDALLAALPRRGLAALPDVRLELRGAGGDRLLVARAPSGSCALFAWPAPSARAVAGGVSAFLSRWPRATGRLSAAPALAELEPERLIASPPPAGAPPPAAVVVASDSCAQAVLTQLAGTLTLLALARIDEREPSVPASLTSHLALPGEVVDDGDVRTVRISGAAASLPIRRAGLDRDPGWVPWLGRVVRIEYVDLREV